MDHYDNPSLWLVYDDKLVKVTDNPEWQWQPKDSEERVWLAYPKEFRAPEPESWYQAYSSPWEAIRLWNDSMDDWLANWAEDPVKDGYWLSKNPLRAFGGSRGSKRGRELGWVLGKDRVVVLG